MSGKQDYSKFPEGHPLAEPLSDDDRIKQRDALVVENRQIKVNMLSLVKSESRWRDRALAYEQALVVLMRAVIDNRHPTDDEWGVVEEKVNSVRFVESMESFITYFGKEVP